MVLRRNLKRTLRYRKCLPALRKEIGADRQNGRRNAALLHEPIPFSVFFSASCSQYVSFKQSSRPGDGGTSEGFEQGPSLMEGLWLSFCVCSRDQLELNPPEREKAAPLQYASWGPQGNQLVSQGSTTLPLYLLILLRL